MGIGRLDVGQSVEIVGWDFGSLGIDALRITIFNTDLPARW
jgi:hypothetical protein